MSSNIIRIEEEYIIFKGMQFLEFITFYQSALHLTRVLCVTFYPSALHHEQYKDVTLSCRDQFLHEFQYC